MHVVSLLAENNTSNKCTPKQIYSCAEMPGCTCTTIMTNLILIKKLQNTATSSQGLDTDQPYCNYGKIWKTFTGVVTFALMLPKVNSNWNYSLIWESTCCNMLP